MDVIDLEVRKTLPEEVCIALPSSKSLHNRLLILKYLYRPQLQIEQASIADDVSVLQSILQNPQPIVNAADAGTAYRFLTAYLSVCCEGKVFKLVGEKRMHERPIASLVNWLQSLGADIQYAALAGCPPLLIRSLPLKGGTIRVEPNISSSQFVSALAMIAPTMLEGLTLLLPQTMLSKPYWDMTLHCMTQVGLSYQQPKEGVFVFKHQKVLSEPGLIKVEKDWSGASFFILLPLLSPSTRVVLEGLDLNSIQGDARFMQHFASQVGLILTQEQRGISVYNPAIKAPDSWPQSLDFAHNPDLSLNCIVLYALMGRSCEITGLESLQYKESDRVKALSLELNKMGANLSHQGSTWLLTPSDPIKLNALSAFSFFSHHDHRIAMALSLVGFKASISIQNAECVSKSFPDFWNTLLSIFTYKKRP